MSSTKRLGKLRDRHQASWACGLLHPRSLILKFALFWVRSREIRDQALGRNREPGDEANIVIVKLYLNYSII